MAEVTGRMEIRAAFSAFLVSPVAGCTTCARWVAPSATATQAVASTAAAGDAGPGAGQPLPPPGDLQRAVGQAAQIGVGGMTAALPDMGVQGIVQRVFGRVVHAVSPLPEAAEEADGSASAKVVRREARALWVWLRTVPWAMPRIAAISESGRSSK